MLAGALPVYQIQFFIKSDKATDALLARTMHRKGSVYWEGEHLAEELNNDKELLDMLKKVIREEGDIFIDPVDNGVRIYGRWRPEYAIRISRDAIEAYNRIAKHVKNHLH